jgi:HD superfamily phosphodiesterase
MIPERRTMNFQFKECRVSKTDMIWRMAEPYLDTRSNDVHTRISVRLVNELLRREGGDESIVIPAMILHDVGWKRVPEHLHLSAFGPKAKASEVNRIHEREGAKIAEEILREIGYDEEKTREIVAIVEGHDSREIPISFNDKLVKDADKLFRYSREGFGIDIARFGETVEEGLERLRLSLERWFFTDSAKAIAGQELAERVKEASSPAKRHTGSPLRSDR